MYAVITNGGKQYRVEVGSVVYLEKFEADAGQNVEFTEVLAIGGEKKTRVGTPTVEGAKVVGKVEKQGKGKKLTIFTYRSKKGSARKMGHRQPFTKVEITEIIG